MIRLIICLWILGNAYAADIYLRPQGKDRSPGTKARPLRTFASAQRAARGIASRSVHFLGGVCYLPQTIVFTGGTQGTVNGERKS